MLEQTSHADERASLARAGAPASSRGFDPVHRIALGDRLELGQGGAHRHKEVVATARRDLHVLAGGGADSGAPES